ncbi:MAG TPA: NAD(P)-dependent oxidoreductase, partial [Bryobacteraceae bacterium]
LLGAGFEVALYNRNAARAEPFRQAGARIAATPAAAAEGADIVIAMVADDQASREVWAGANGVLSSASPGAIFIESSTVMPEWIRELSLLAERRGSALLDAPVTGSRPQAHAGELLFLVGGDADVLERARPVLQPMSRAIVHLGPSGAGAAMKLINNFFCGVQAAGLAEAIAWIERSGLERAQAVSILTGGAPGSPLVKALAERMANRDYDINFRLDLMAKDLAYAASEASSQGVELSTAAAALARFREAVQAGHGGKDLAAVVEPFRG